MHPAIGEITVPLRQDGVLIIGRKGSGASVELNWDTKISRRHAKVWREESFVVFEDLGSANGSWREKEQLTGTTVIEPGVPILVGETAMIVEVNQETSDEWTSVETDKSALLAVEQVPQLDTNFDDGVSTSIMLMDEDEASGEISDIHITPSVRPRMLDEGTVEVLIATRAAFAAFWAQHEKTGLYLETTAPPAFGTDVRVQIATPDGDLELVAQVVHVVDASIAQDLNMAPGVGLALKVEGKLREHIQAYIEGRSPDLGQQIAATGDIHAIVSAAGKLLGQFDAGDYYAALDLESNATPTAIERRVEELTELCNPSEPDLSPAQHARINAARRALRKMASLLTDPKRRLRYDFAAGFHRIEERLAVARRGGSPNMAELRDAWNQALPKRVDQAAAYTRRAFAAQSSNLEEAIALAEKALALNPFFEPLRAQLEKWRVAVDRDG